MTLKDQLMEDLKDAMRSGDELRKSTIRLTRSAIRNAELSRSKEILDAIDLNLPAPSGVPQAVINSIREGRERAAEYDESGQPELANKQRDAVGALLERVSEFSDNEVQDVLRKEIKQRRDSADVYKHGGRSELADKELAEVAILEKYLPTQMSEQEIEAEVRAIVAEVGATGPKDMNKVMPTAMSRLRGRADGRTINQTVSRILSES